MVLELLKVLRLVHRLENDRTIAIDTLEERLSQASGVQQEDILRESKNHDVLYLRWALYYIGSKD